MNFLRLWRVAGVHRKLPPYRLLPAPVILQSRVRSRALPAILALAATSEGYYIWNTSKTQELPALESLPVPPGIPEASLFKRNPVKALSLELAEAKLVAGQGQGSFKNVKFHTYRLGSNFPVEDQYVFDSRPSLGGKDWYYWGVFDGHAGWAMASMLKDSLVPVVAQALQSSNGASLISTIKKAFVGFDQEILDNAASFLQDIPKSSAEGITAIAPATAGSCALLSMFDPSSSILRVANVGDSRAVLGRYDESSGKYITVKLSEDQTGFNAKEVARLAEQHPGEDKIIDPKSGRLLGIAITRAFGDHRWKWPVDLIHKAKERYRASAPRPLTQTPPYMTAEPEITETEIRQGTRGDFVIMASDGLWDNISSEDAVECVARWLNTPAKERITKGNPKDSREDPVRNGKYMSWMATPEHFVVENDNAATHLVKNAFGGSRRDLFRAVMSAYPPLSRNIRDDITVQVIFFTDKV